MTMLEKFVYIADYIEPARNKAPRLTEIRRLAFEDLDECMYQILKDTLSYLDENPNDVDSATKDAYAYYTMLHEDRLKFETGLIRKGNMFMNREQEMVSIACKAIDDKKALDINR